MKGIPLPPTPDGQYKFSRRGLVYELDRGWSFDGEYIHFLELNWFFGENPFVLDTIQKIRIHGLVKGVVNLAGGYVRRRREM